MDLEAILKAYDKAIKEEVEAAGYLGYLRGHIAELRAKILTYSKSKPPAAATRPVVQNGAAGHGAAARPPVYRRSKQTRPSKVVAATIDAVRALGGKATTATFAKHLSITPAAARVRLIRATDKGFLVREEPGVYRLPDTTGTAEATVRG